MPSKAELVNTKDFQTDVGKQVFENDLIIHELQTQMTDSTFGSVRSRRFSGRSDMHYESKVP